MSAIDAALVAYAARDGIGYRRANYRHRRLAADPIALVAFQPGGEPFSVAALAYGNSATHFELAVPGQPLDRTLLFAALTPVAAWFNARFETPWAHRVEVTQGKRNPKTVERAPYPPQLIVTNGGVVKLLRNLGRRLAYLPTDPSSNGPPPAPMELVRFGRHLAFCTSHYREPGQQILIDMVTLASDSWMTAQTPGERANLGALDAWIEPPAGTHGFAAAAVAERQSVGPIPNPEDERIIADAVERLDQAQKTANASVEQSARTEIEAEYRDLAQHAWTLLWRVRNREVMWPEEPVYTPERVALDVAAYSAHMAWMDGPAEGRRRARDSVRAAIRARRHSENAASRVVAQQACADPLLMISYLLDHKAIEGEIGPFDFDHVEVKPGNIRATAAPRLRLRTERPSRMPAGKELWWSERPNQVSAVVESVGDDPAGPGSLVELKIVEGARAASPLRTKRTACFSVLSTGTYSDFAPLPAVDPFTHIPHRPTVVAPHLEPEGETTSPLGGDVP